MEHKDFILPEVDLSHDEGDPRWLEHGPTTPIYREDGSIRAYRWNGLEPGHYAGYWQLCVADAWAENVARFEASPDDVYAAYWYLDHHPVYWKFDLDRRKEGWPDNHVGHLDHDSAWYRNCIDIFPHRDDEGLFFSYETGPYDILPVDHGGWMGQMRWLDTSLDGRADTYELAVCALARRIHESYGNDRRVVDSPVWRGNAL